MSFWSIIRGKKTGEIPTMESVPPPPVRKNEQGPAAYNSIWTLSFDGEKNVGEIGPIKNYVADHSSLSVRAWQLYLESEICQTIIKRFATWVVGRGLKLQAEPNVDVLKSEKINLPSEFIGITETRFKVFSNDPMSDYSDMQPLQKKLSDIFINAVNSGDVLVIQRLIDGVLKIQVIDGCHISTPFNLSLNSVDFVTDSGNRIRHGVEIDSRGNHIAYHVKTSPFKWERIAAIGSNGHRMAFLVYGSKFRLDNVRGIPLVSAVMETVSKMDRYKEATLASAEETAKLAFAIEHNAISTGENPFDNQMAESIGLSHFASGDNPVDINEKKLLANVAATTNKQAVNLPNGAKLTAVESKKELYFNDFYTINIQIVCAAIGIPPEVAMMKYDSNFSASRAALKDWEHTLNVKRESFAAECLQPIYNLWLEVEILNNKVSAPGYMQALGGKNKMVLAAYRFARFIGANVPHIDPMKEVAAERAKLGTAGAHLPLTTLEAATEVLNGGDSETNLQYFAEELKKAESLDIQVTQTQVDNSQNI